MKKLNPQKLLIILSILTVVTASPFVSYADKKNSDDDHSGRTSNNVFNFFEDFFNNNSTSTSTPTPTSRPTITPVVNSTTTPRKHDDQTKATTTPKHATTTPTASPTATKTPSRTATTTIIGKATPTPKVEVIKKAIRAVNPLPFQIAQGTVNGLYNYRGLNIPATVSLSLAAILMFSLGSAMAFPNAVARILPRGVESKKEFSITRN